MDASPSAPPRPTPRAPAVTAVALAGAGTVAGLAALVLLRTVEPAGQPYFPRCFLYAASGFQCPACGILRATHALLNGRLADAWRLNPLFVLLLPLVGWTGLAGAGRLLGRTLPQPLAHPWGIGLVLGLAAGFGVARNFPGWPWPAP